MVVQSGLDNQQRLGNIEQTRFVETAARAAHFFDDQALFLDHLARDAKAEHAQRIADPTQGFGGLQQHGGIGVTGAQEHVEHFLDAQKIVLDRVRHRVQQGPVMAGHRTFGLLHLAIGRQRRLELIDTTHFGNARAVSAGVCDVIEQALHYLAWRLRGEAVLAFFGETLELAVNLAE